MPETVDISPKQDKGILKEILQEGEGIETPPNGCKVKVHYTGRLTDGTQFDSSRDRGSPFEFELGNGSVIKAWDIGVATMKKGERAMLTCAAEYAYGEAGNPPTIPPGATLKFDVEVISWMEEDLSPGKDGSIRRVIITPGEGYTSPNDGAMVNIHLIGRHNDRVFDDRDVSFNIGEGEDVDIVEGVEKALESFKKQETSRLVIQAKYAYGKTGCEKHGIPAEATLEYTVTLKSFEKAKESWLLDNQEKIDNSKISKEKGTNYFKAGKLTSAIKMYKKVLSVLESEHGIDGELAVERISLLVSANLNLALVYLKQNKGFVAKKYATEAINLDNNNEKAHFRRGQAYLVLKEAKLAAADFATCLKIAPDNKAAQAQLALCKKILAEQLQEEKKIYGNMFEKFAKMDTQKEEEEKKKEPDVMSSLGEWGKEDREREPTEFEKENPNILLLNGSGQFKDM